MLREVFLHKNWQSLFRLKCNKKCCTVVSMSFPKCQKICVTTGFPKHTHCTNILSMPSINIVWVANGMHFDLTMKARKCAHKTFQRVSRSHVNPYIM